MNQNEISLYDGITLHTMKTDRFKTNYIAIVMFSNLNRETVTQNALIPLVLRRGTKSFPTMQDISIKLEDMYGASLDSSIDKIGDFSCLQFVMDMISDEYSLDNSSIFAQGWNLISEVLLSPTLENGVFRKEYVEQEKDTLRELINSRINDKSSYSLSRTIEEMYKNEPFGLYKYGYVEDLDSINETNLYEQYLKLLKTSDIHIYISGNINEKDITEKITKVFSQIDREYRSINAIQVAFEAANKMKTITASNMNSNNEIVEKQNVIQGKLVLGYKVLNANLKEDFYKMVVYSAILGGTASSKLFMNVREKKSLAYTINSRYIKHKGAMVVSAGIEIENYELAKECILKEINDMKIGEITEEEIHDAKVNLTTAYKSSNDSQSALIGWSIGQNVLGGEQDISKVIERLNNINKEDIVEIANRLNLDTIYYLTV